MIYTRLNENLPSGVGGFTLLDANGDYTIFLNAHASREHNVQTVEHEMEHIKKGDFYATDGADYIEYKRHKLTM